MGKPLDDRVKKILKKLEFDPKECLWDCHGTWVMYHRFIEIAGASAGIRYILEEVETNSQEGIVCIKCSAGNKVDATDHSFIPEVTTYGEASPKNNKNSYPYAMAEKRAVDRAILKLLGLHGFIYSEDEMDHASPPPKSKSLTEEDYNSLSKNEQLKAITHADHMIERYKVGDIEGCRKAFYDKGHSQEFQSAIWFLLKKESKLRTAVADLQARKQTTGDK